MQVNSFHQQLAPGNDDPVVQSRRAALHALMDVQDGVTGGAGMLHVLTGRHTKRDQTAGPEPAEMHQDKSHIMNHPMLAFVLRCL